MLRLALISLHTSPHDEPGRGDVGGMNVLVHRTALELGRLGHRVDVLTRRTSPHAPGSVAVAPGVTLRRLTAGPAEPRDKADHEEYIDEFSRALSTLGPYDLLHAHHWFSGIAALPVAAARGIPLVQSFHSIAADPSTPLAEGERPESPGRLAGESLLARRSNLVIAVSEAERATVLGRLGATPSHVVTVPPGVDTTLFRPDPTGTSVPQPGRVQSMGYLVIAARLEPLKGVDLGIRTLAALPRPRPALLVSGGPTSGYTDYPARLHRLAARLGVANEVRFVGPQSRDSLAALLRGARLLLVPSHSETFGLIALEAQASGIPVVASAAGGLREAVADGRTGILIEGRDPSRWADVVAALLHDPQRRRHLGQAGRARALRFPWSRSARGVTAAYAKLVAR